MPINVKNLKTDEIIRENLEITDIMYGAFDGDDRMFIFLPNGEHLVYSPMNEYLAYDPVVDEPLPEPEPLPELTPDELRKLAYEMEPIILWDDETITVDAAGMLWLHYSAEDNDKAAELTELIMAAKAEIRERYPD